LAIGDWRLALRSHRLLGEVFRAWQS